MASRDLHPLHPFKAAKEINIGAYTLLRAAANNHAGVCVLADSDDYVDSLKGIELNEITEKSRLLYPLKAFTHPRDYEATTADVYSRTDIKDSIKMKLVQMLMDLDFNMKSL